MSDDNGHIAELRRAHLFADLADEQLRLLSKGMHELSLTAGEGLFAHGQPAERFFFVRDGLVKLFRLAPDGGEKIIELIKPGETFAEAVMFMGLKGRYPVSAEAVSDTQLFAFGQRAFLSLLQESPDICFGLLASLSRRLHMLVNQIESLTLQNATYRLVAYLLEQTPPDVMASPEIQLPPQGGDRLAARDSAGDAVAHPRAPAARRVDRRPGLSHHGSRHRRPAQAGADAGRIGVAGRRAPASIHPRRSVLSIQSTA